MLLVAPRLNQMRHLVPPCHHQCQLQTKNAKKVTEGEEGAKLEVTNGTRGGGAAPRHTLGEESVFIPSLTLLRVMKSKVPEPEESTHRATSFFRAVFRSKQRYTCVRLRIHLSKLPLTRRTNARSLDSATGVSASTHLPSVTDRQQVLVNNAAS